MVGLQDFNPGAKKPEISDFFAMGREPTPVASSATIDNVAAHVAMMSGGGDIVSTYQKITDDLQYGSSSPTMMRVLDQYDQNDFQNNFTALKGILSDPDISYEDKKVALDTYHSMSSAPKLDKTLSNRLGDAALMSESEPTDNDEAILTREDIATRYDQIDVYNGMVQKALNSIQEANKDRAVGSWIEDFAELFLPFMEGAASAEVTAALKSGAVDKTLTTIQGLTLLGENKATLRDAIQNAPIENRIAMGKLVISLLKETQGSATLRPNVLNQITQMEDFLLSGSYTDTDRFTDNLFSVLDDTILLAPLKIVGKGFARIGEAVSGGLLRSAGADKAAIARYENAVKNLTPETAVTVKSVLDEGTPILSNTLANSDKEAVVTAMTDKIIDNIVKDMDADVANQIRNSVRRSMDGFNPAMDTTRHAEEIVQNARDTASKSILSGISEEGVKAVDEVFASDISRRSVKSGTAPTSVAEVYNQTNPAKKRALHNAVVEDTTGQVAKATYGTTRVDAVADDILPEVNTQLGTVRNKVSVVDESAPTPNQSVIDKFNSSRGDSQYTPEEKIEMRGKAKDDWRDVVGMTPRTEMSTVGDTERGVSFDMVYGPKDGGFRKPSDAVNQAVYSLRKYGITEDNIELLRLNKNGEYEPTDKSNLNMNLNGNYLARVRYDYEFSPGDVVSWGLIKNDPKAKLFDVVTPLDKSGQGGLWQHVFPSFSLVDYQKLFKPASRASDKTAYLTKLLVEAAGDYAKFYKSLDAKQKYLVDSYKIEANSKGIPFNSVYLKSRGMNDNAVNTLKAWKEIQDTLYHFENVDLIKTLRSKGYGRFIDQKGDTDLYVRPATRGSVQDGIRAYNSETNTIDKLGNKELDELYESGGTIAYTRGNVDFGEGSFKAVIVRENNETSYIRRIRDDDRVLNYRHGYYHKSYLDPIFITQTVKGEDGVEFQKAIGTVGNREDARRVLERLRATDAKVDSAGESIYKMREDLKRGTSDFDEYEWSSLVASGRSAQRVRGEQLKNFSETDPDPNFTHMESPEESLVRSIYSVAKRVNFRDYLETAKARWMNQFGNLVETQQGQKFWPNNVDQVGSGTAIEAGRGTINDARNAWRYIDSMESGYSNLIDIWSKNFFKEMSDIAGGTKSWKWLETPLRKASEVGPTGYSRKKAFRLLLAADPVRSLVVQSSQALPVIAATNPLAFPKIMMQNTLLNYIVTGGDVDSFFKGLAKMATGLTKAEAVELVKHYQQSGFEAAVEANSLIRDQINRITDKTFMDKVRRASGQPINLTQKVGYNTGENILMRSVWLSEYDLLRRRKNGAAITTEDIDNVSARVRALTGDMNMAGELPYNHNTFSLLMQFYQMPHKTAAAIFLGHNGLTKWDRARLGTSYILTFGLGMGPLTSTLSNIIPGEDKGAIREVLEGGLFNILMNKALSTLYQSEEVNVDFSDSFRLLEQPNVAEFLTNLVTVNLSEIIAATPSGGLVFGDNPRITEFIMAAARPFYVDPEQKLQEVANAGKEFLNIFSGMSNAFKAQYILEHQKVMSSSGIITDYDSNSMEAMMKLANFQTRDEVLYYATTGTIIEKRKKRDEDIKNWLREANKRMAVEGISRDSLESLSRITSEAIRVWGKDQNAMEEISRQLRYQAMTGENTMFNTIINSMGWMKKEDISSLLESLPSNVTPEQRKSLKDFFNAVYESE
jgi:hypothetical protein